MIIKRLNCSICHVEFTTTSRNAKYCSEECRQEGTYQQRKEWESKTNYKEKQREAMQQYRKEKTEIKNVINIEERNRKDKERKKETEKRINERQAELMDRVKAGDPLARMTVAKPQSIEYWEAYQDYAINYAESSGEDSRRIVNGISVHEPDFAEKVILTIEELGHVKTELY